MDKNLLIKLINRAMSDVDWQFYYPKFTYMPLITLFVGLFFTLIAYDMYKRKAKRAFFYGIASVVIILFALFSF